MACPPTPSKESARPERCRSASREFRRLPHTLRLHGADMSGLDPAARARRGLGRTFQKMELFDSLTARENVSLGWEAARAGPAPWRHLVQTRADRLDGPGRWPAGRGGPAQLRRLDQHAAADRDANAPLLAERHDAVEHAVGALDHLDGQHCPATAAAWPMSGRGGGEQLHDPRAMSPRSPSFGRLPARLRRAGSRAPPRARRQRNLPPRRPHDAGQRVVVAAKTRAMRGSRRIVTVKAETETEATEGQARHRTDEDEVAAAFLAQQVKEATERLTTIQWQGSARPRGRQTAQREHDHAAPAPARGVGDRQRQAAAAAGVAERARITRQRSPGRFRSGHPDPPAAALGRHSGVARPRE
jgi:hypothetical protein